jgi:hypothetical protein
MLRAALLTRGSLAAVTVAAAALLSAAAFAQANIPTRYSGKFPSDGLRKDITGTFTGKGLTLRFRRPGAKRASATTHSQVCPPTWLER